MDEKLTEIAIGAFLHDIGKLSQRAKGKLSEHSEGLRRYICPKGPDEQYTHLHAAYTSDFFESMGQWLPKELDKSKIANLASYHHNPDTPEQVIVQQADWLSAGQDRREGEREDTPRYLRAKLKSVFSSIRTDANHGSLQPRWFSILPQTLDEKAFPKEADDEKYVEQAYRELFELAMEHFRKLRQAPLELYLEQLQWVFGLYSWYVPCSLREAPDVSLLDHSLTTAALATVLYQYHTKTNTMNKSDVCDKKIKKFRLVAGDIGGIQPYIFRFAQEEPKGASKRLRARSFCISLLAQLAAHLILHDLGLPCFNKVIDAGGHFILLIPNTHQTISQLQHTERQIQDWFFKIYQGLISLNLSYELELTGDDFEQKKFKSIFERLSWSVEKIKKQPFHLKLRSDGKWDRQAYCHQPDPRKFDKAEREFFTKLGQILPRSRYLLVSIDSPAPEGLTGWEGLKTEYIRPFGRIGINFEENYPQDIDNLHSLIEFVPNPAQPNYGDILCGQFMANFIPRQTKEDRSLYTRPEIEEWLEREQRETEEKQEVFCPDNPKTFAHIAIDSLMPAGDGKLKGHPMLAVLKADVDRLGLIFKEGLGEKVSIGPPPDYPYFSSIYTIYAGGDDLLFVGPWWVMFDFAIYLNKAFRQYTTENDSITISAGLAVFHHRFPLSHAVEQANELLDQAKNAGRNKIVVFGSVLSWDNFRQAIEDAKFLDKALNGGTEGIEISKGFVYRLLEYYRMWQDTTKDATKVSSLKWRSQLAYDKARNVKSTLDDKNVVPPGLKRLEEMTGLTTDKSVMEKLKVSVTYCLYLNRGGIR